MTYIIILAFLVYCAWDCDLHANKKRKKILYLIAFMIFFLLSGLRYKIGGDTLNYMASWDMYPTFWQKDWLIKFTHLQNMSGFTRYQPGWMLYAVIVKSINPSFITLQLISSLLINYAIFRAIKKYSPYPFLTLLIYYLTFTFYQFEFELARECVAVALYLLFGFDSWINKNWTRYYIGTTIAYLIHPSALIMFFLPLMRNIKWKNQTYIRYLIIPTICICIIGKAFLGNLIFQLTSAESMILSYNERALNTAYNNNYLVSVLLTPTIIISMMLLWRKYAIKIFVPLIFTSCVLMIMALFDFDCVRFANFIIIPVYIALTPIFHHLIKRNRTIWVAVLLMTVYSLPQAYVVYRGGDVSWSRYFPYQTLLYPHQTPTQQKYWN